jgi:hypothetical protein
MVETVSSRLPCCICIMQQGRAHPSRNRRGSCAPAIPRALGSSGGLPNPSQRRRRLPGKEAASRRPGGGLSRPRIEGGGRRGRESRRMSARSAGANRAPPGLESLIPAPPSTSELLRGRLRAPPRADESAGARICAVGDRPPLQAVAGEMAAVASRRREQRRGRGLLEQATSSSTATGSASGGPAPPPPSQVVPRCCGRRARKSSRRRLPRVWVPARSSSAVASRRPARRREWRRARSGAHAGARRREMGADRAVEMQTPKDARARGLAAFCSSLCSCRWSHYSASRARKTQMQHGLQHLLEIV